LFFVFPDKLFHIHKVLIRKRAQPSAPVPA
jgi:hypothetical protein